MDRSIGYAAIILTCAALWHSQLLAKCSFHSSSQQTDAGCLKFVGMENCATIRSPEPKVSKHVLENWHMHLTEHHILKSIGSEREHFEDRLKLPNLPEMIFDKNCISITYGNEQDPSVSRLTFSAIDALELVDKNRISVEVPIAKDWREARMEMTEPLGQPKPYDWTFTTSYTGTLVGPWTVEPSEQGLDMTLLQRRDPILFFAETTLFEDELGDNGVSMLNVKLRVMQTGFFLLQRFFLRVDGGLVRVFDTRIQWRKGDDYLIRDIRRAESSTWLPTMAGITLMEAEHSCDRVLENRLEKLFPRTSKSS